MAEDRFIMVPERTTSLLFPLSLLIAYLYSLFEQRAYLSTIKLCEYTLIDVPTILIGVMS